MSLLNRANLEQAVLDQERKREAIKRTRLWLRDKAWPTYPLTWLGVANWPVIGNLALSPEQQRRTRDVYRINLSSLVVNDWSPEIIRPLPQVTPEGKILTGGEVGVGAPTGLFTRAAQALGMAPAPADASESIDVRQIELRPGDTSSRELHVSRPQFLRKLNFSEFFKIDPDVGMLRPEELEAAPSFLAKAGKIIENARREQERQDNTVDLGGIGAGIDLSVVLPSEAERARNADEAVLALPEFELTPAPTRPKMSSTTPASGVTRFMQLINGPLQRKQYCKCDGSDSNVEQRRPYFVEMMQCVENVAKGADMVAACAGTLFGSASNPTIRLFRGDGPHEGRYINSIFTATRVEGEVQVDPEVVVDMSESVRNEVSKALKAVIMSYGITYRRSGGVGDLAAASLPLSSYETYGDRFTDIGELQVNRASDVKILSPVVDETAWYIDGAGAKATTIPTVVAPVAVIAYVQIRVYIEFIGQNQVKKLQTRLRAMKAAQG